MITESRRLSSPKLSSLSSLFTKFIVRANLQSEFPRVSKSSLIEIANAARLALRLFLESNARVEPFVHDSNDWHSRRMKTISIASNSIKYLHRGYGRVFASVWGVHDTREQSIHSGFPGLVSPVASRKYVLSAARVAQPRLFVEEQQVKLVVVLSPSTIPPGDSSLSLSSLSIQSPSSRWNVNSTRPSRAHEHALRFTLCRFTPKNTQMISL